MDMNVWKIGSRQDVIDNALYQPSKFKIIPRSVSLFSGEDCIFATNIKYCIPIYQRPYSWEENELRKLMESLRDAVRSKEPVFMGTMQLSQPMLNSDLTEKAYYIIDGQQRITTFMILNNVIESYLGMPVTPLAESKLWTRVSRGEEQIKLDAYSKFINKPIYIDKDERNTYIRNYHIIKALLTEYFLPEKQDAEVEKLMVAALYEFIKSDKIQFVVIETHAGLSKTLQIFDTINSTGMDLNATDLFKIRFYEYLKKHGMQEDVFDDISDIYASIEEYNRTHIQSPAELSMADVLRTYQRIIFARHDLPQSVFYKSYETFFDELFDTLLHIRIHDEFKGLIERDDVHLTIDDLKRIITCYKENYDLQDENIQHPGVDWNFRIICNLIWETRYGYIWDLPIIARFFNKIENKQIPEFTLRLFKLLCPPSLRYAKVINVVQSSILDILKRMRGQEDGVKIIKDCSENWQVNGQNLESMLEEACSYEITSYPKWKNLICRLVEYLKSDKKDKKLFERLWLTPIDIEHIQCYTDENDAEKVRNDWGAELNCLGNLVLLERTINRSISNRRQSKPDAYRNSDFVSVKELSDLVDGKWTKMTAWERRKTNTDLLKDFLLNKK